MKYVITAAMAAFLVSTPAMADTVQTEVEVGVFGQETDTKAFTLRYNGSRGILTHGVEVKVRETDLDNPLARAALSNILGSDVQSIATTRMTGSLGVALPTPLATIKAEAQVGRSASKGNKFEYWGAQVSASRTLYGPVDMTVSYRHRESFSENHLNQERLGAGLSYNLSESMNVDVNYYRYFGSEETGTDAVSVGFTRKF